MKILSREKCNNETQILNLRKLIKFSAKNFNKKGNREKRTLFLSEKNLLQYAPRP